MLARSKLNSIEGKTSNALIDNEISHEDLMTILNEEKYRELEWWTVKQFMLKKLVWLNTVKK